MLSLKESLQGAEMHDNFGGKNVISITTDGATVQTGRVNGLNGSFLKSSQFTALLIPWSCQCTIL